MLRTRLRVTALTLALSSLSALAPSGSLAQTTDDTAAQAHFQAAASYYEMGAYEDALREFQVAYDLSQRAELLYNLTLCYQQLGDLPHAVESLERYLNDVADIPNRAALTVRLGNLRERAARGDTHAGDTETGASAEPTEPSEDSGPEEMHEAPAPRGESLNVGAIAGFSVAAVGVVGAVIFGSLTLALNGELAGGCGATRSCSDGQIGTLQTYALLTDISFGVALVGAAVGTILLLVGGGSNAATEAALSPSLRLPVRLSPMAGGSAAGPTAGLVLDGSF